MVLPEGRNVGCRYMGGNAKSSCNRRATANSATWPMNDSFLGLYILRVSGVGDGAQQEARAIVEFRFFRRRKLQSCLLGLEETKKKKIWPGGDDKFIFFRICRISFDGPHWAVIDVVFQKRNAACICFGANGKKTK